MPQNTHSDCMFTSALLHGNEGPASFATFLCQLSCLPISLPAAAVWTSLLSAFLLVLLPIFLPACSVLPVFVLLSLCLIVLWILKPQQL